MKRVLLLLLFIAGLAAVSPAQADVFLLGFSGFDYQDPNPDAGNYLAVGEGYKVLGEVTSVGPLLAPYYDPVTFEYTLYMFNLTVSSRSFGGGFLVVNFFDNGRGRYFEDSRATGTSRNYGTNPPNATAPSTFIDGSLKLGGDIDQFQLVYNFNTNSGNFSGRMTQDEGTALIYIPVDQRSGWVLSGLAGAPNPTIPLGYDHQLNGECRIVETAATHRTWGAIKSLYR